MINNLSSVLFILLFLCTCAVSSGSEKSDRLKPKWVTHSLPESPSPDDYVFIRAHGEGTSLAGAKEMAFVAMTRKIEAERGVTVQVQMQSRERIMDRQSGSEDTYEQEITLDVTERGRQFNIVCREIDDWWTRKDGRYETDVLYAVSKSRRGSTGKGNFVVTAKYGASGLLSIIPGVGQYYKGSIVKGSLILGGEIIAAGGIIFCENTRASYIKKIEEQPKYTSEYASLADNWETGRNICIGAAAALYVYNLIDALAAPGAKRIKFKRDGKVSVALAPQITTDSFGFGLAMKF